MTQATTTPRLRQAWNRLGFPEGTDGNGSLTHIQQQTWPVVALGYDLLAFAATGKGKTLAFGAPALDAVFQEVNSSCNIAGEAVDVAGKRPVTSAPNGYQLPSSIRPSNVARLVVVQATKEMVDQMIRTADALDEITTQLATLNTNVSKLVQVATKYTGMEEEDWNDVAMQKCQ